MTVHELSRDQLDELKQNYVFETVENPSYEELADSVDIPDEVVFDFYAGIHFFNDDFLCTAGKD